MKRTIFILSALFCLAIAAQAQSNKDQVKDVVTTAYVNGIHNGGPIEDIRDGFHQGFKMFIMSNDNLNEVTRDGWIERIEASRAKEPNRKYPVATGKFARVTVTGNNATVELELLRDGKKVFTDNLALYKFSNGWKIVSKTFYRHPD